jgi:hypothetical protein
MSYEAMIECRWLMWNDGGMRSSGPDETRLGAKENGGSRDSTQETSGETFFE